MQYLKKSSAEILEGFECGIPVMDHFIQNFLNTFLQKDPRYSFYFATENGFGIVAMFVISDGIFVDYDEEFADLPFGKPWGYMDDDFQLRSGTMYPTSEIDYLAVRKDLREKGFGTEIIAELSERARQKSCFFLTVDAYHDRKYSAIPFYEKQGFFPLQEYSEDCDTLRMALRV